MESKNPILSFWQKSLGSKLIVIIVGFLILAAIIGVLTPQGQKSFKEGQEAGKGKSENQETPTPKVERKENKNTPVPTKKPTPTPRKITYELIKPYLDGNEKWQTIIVPNDSTIEELTSLAKDIHKNNLWFIIIFLITRMR